jgi:hypothetical protein
MMDGTALPKSHSLPSEPSSARYSIFSPQAFQALLIVLGIAITTFVLYLYVLPNSQIDAARVRIADLRAQTARLERENAALQQLIAQESNLKAIETRAKALGMGPARSAIYLQLPDNNMALADSTNNPSIEPSTVHGPATVTEWLQRDHLEDRLREFRWNVSQIVEGIFQRFRIR